ncbi:MAG TPA: helix-turn-helix domain-containing protein [Gaiellaceae bacterium]
MAAVEDTRSRIEGALRAAPDGLDVAQLATRVGVHPNTVRWHLGTLADRGVVSAMPQAHHGRGRPRIVYRAAPERTPGTRDEYRLLATILSSTLAAVDDGAATAERAGRAWGRFLAPRRLPLVRASDDDARQAVTALLDEQGFCPESCAGELRIHRCPFHDLAESQPEVVCAVHRGLIDGAFEELGSDLRIAALDVFVEPDLCVARLTSGPSEPSSRAASAARA